MQVSRLAGKPAGRKPVKTTLHALATLQHVATGKAMAGYIAGAIVIAFTTIYSFIGHKKVTFRQPPPSN
jgi:putative flippase GtrA